MRNVLINKIEKALEEVKVLDVTEHPNYQLTFLIATRINFYLQNFIKNSICSSIKLFEIIGITDK